MLPLLLSPVLCSAALVAEGLLPLSALRLSAPLSLPELLSLPALSLLLSVLWRESVSPELTVIVTSGTEVAVTPFGSVTCSGMRCTPSPREATST